MSDTGRRVRFTADYDYKPTPMITLAYKAGTVAYVRKECAEQAVRLGRAEAVDIPTIPSGIAATIAKRKPRRGRQK